MEAKQKTTVKERPILMSAPMVQAILAGRKTQTRRVIKQNIVTVRHGQQIVDMSLLPKFPYGQIGDRLWVRETFAYYNTGRYDRPEMGVFYRADGERDDRIRGRWRPSIHMPRDVSRLLLEITGVRVERVQSISESDIFAEGFGPDPAEIDDWEGIGLVRDRFMHLWNSINEKRGFGCTKNPWVWCVSFQRVEEAKQ